MGEIATVLVQNKIDLIDEAVFTRQVCAVKYCVWVISSFSQMESKFDLDLSTVT